MSFHVINIDKGSTHCDDSHILFLPSAPVLNFEKLDELVLKLKILFAELDTNVDNTPEIYGKSKYKRQTTHKI